MTDQQRPESRSVGRPSLYKPEYCETVIALGREGKSKAQIAAKLDVSRQTLENWGKAYPEFLDAITRAKDLELAWWEDTAQGGLGGGVLNAALWSRSMAARFPADYREEHRTEITGKDGGPVATRDDTPGLGAVKSALAGMLARTQDAPDDGEGQ